MEKLFYENSLIARKSRPQPMRILNIQGVSLRAGLISQGSFRVTLAYSNTKHLENLTQVVILISQNV